MGELTQALRTTECGRDSMYIVLRGRWLKRQRCMLFLHRSSTDVFVVSMP
jgi:hypothetical protein